MTTYCAPCLADLALSREAVTSVSGTAACVAHAVLLTHPGDSPQRRLTRLADLRAMAEGKLPTAAPEEVPQIELLVQEYALAGAMDMTVPLKDLAGDRTPRPPKNRNRRDRDRGRDRDRERGPRPEGGAPAVPEPGQGSAPDSGAERGPGPAASADAATAAAEANGRSDSGAESAPEQTTPAAPQPAPAAPQPAAEPAPQPSAEAPVAE